MLNYNRVIDRYQTSCAKWDYTSARFGKDGLLPFWVADMDFETSPSITNAIHDRVNHGIFGYTVFDQNYYQSMVNWYKKRFSVDASPDWIVYSPTVILSLVAMMEVFTNHREKVIIQTPVYGSFKATIEKHSREVVENPLKLVDDKYEIDFDDLEDKAKDPLVKILVLCNPQNPVGRVFTEAELLRIGQICYENDILIFADEIHCDIVYPSQKHTPFFSLPQPYREIAVTCNSIGKTFNLSGLQVSNMVIPNDKIRKSIELYLTDKLNFHLVNPLGQAALIAAYSNGEAWVDNTIAYIQENALYVFKTLEEQAPELTIVKPEGTYFLWINLDSLGFKDNESLHQWLVDELQVAIYTGAFFGEKNHRFIRLNIACPRHTLDEFMHRLIDGIKDLNSSTSAGTEENNV